MDKLKIILLLCAGAARAACGFEIGEAMESGSFWTDDPVKFVRTHADDGFQFTSAQRDAADSRQDGAVTFHGVPVFETRVLFAPDRPARVELLLFNTGGTETTRTLTDEEGRVFRRRTRVDKTISQDEFTAILRTVRTRLTPAGAKLPPKENERTPDAATRQARQTWPRTDLPTQTTLTWNYKQQGKRADTFRAGFIRVTVNGPARLAEAPAGRAAAAPAAAKGAAKIADNVVRDSRGDVFIDNVPMVDQGQKGYCSAATAERVLRYFGLEVDEHDIAQAAGTSAEGGTGIREMKNSVEAVGRRYKLATVVCYGNFDKAVRERIAGLDDEVKAYNKVAKKLKKPGITEDMYVRRTGSSVMYSPQAVDDAMDPDVRKEMRVNGTQKSKYTKFLADVQQQIDKGIPLFWGVRLGIFPEPGIPQAGGGHMRLIIGYNNKKKEIIYTDSWGAGHEVKRMPADWAWTISHCLMYMKPLAR